MLGLVMRGAVGVPAARAAVVTVPRLTVFTDQLAGPPLMGLGVELDPYDTVAPGQINETPLTQRTTERLGAAAKSLDVF
jgi:hypothetical protein